MTRKNDARERQHFQGEIVQRIRDLGFYVTPRTDLGPHVHSLNDEMFIAFEYAHLNARREYVFKLDKERLDAFYAYKRNFFQFFICESAQRVFIVPLALLVEIMHDIFTTGFQFREFKPVVKLRNGVWFLRFMGQYDLTDYLNRYDFLITESKTYKPQTTRYNSVIEVQTLEERFVRYTEETDLRRDSLHSATVDMLRRIGEWSGFRVVTEGVPVQMPDFPYQIDVLWYKNDDLFLAVEVCHHGAVEKDKDALKLAKQHGARKVIIVSEINKMERIRKLFQFEGDIKNWVEIWSFERVFNMYEAGLKFFKDFEKFRRYGWQDGLSEFI